MPDEYISREAALVALQDSDLFNTTERQLRAIRELPVADVAPVVRCRDCEYVRPTVSASTGERVGIWCALHDILNVSPDDYCSRGQKKGMPE